MKNWEKETKYCKKLNKNRIKKPIVFNIPHINKKYNIDIYENKINIEYSDRILHKDENLDRHISKKIKNHKIKIENVLDLHGFNFEEAFELLAYNIEEASCSGKKCILVITGKGHNTKEGHDSIKMKITSWLNHPRLVNKISHYSDALAIHGGTGALYIFIKNK